jgi:hypothetical protein
LTLTLAMQEKVEDMAATCFICSMDRKEFDRRGEGYARRGARARAQGARESHAGVRARARAGFSAMWI